MVRDEVFETRRSAILFQVVRAFILLLLAISLPAHAADTSTKGTLGDLHSDKRVVQSGRWFLVREFTVEFAVHDPTQKVCGQIVTTDATEANDLINSSGQPVEVTEKGKDLYVTLKNGRRVKAHRLNVEKCPQSS